MCRLRMTIRQMTTSFNRASTRTICQNDKSCIPDNSYAHRFRGPKPDFAPSLDKSSSELQVMHIVSLGQNLASWVENLVSHPLKPSFTAGTTTYFRGYPLQGYSPRIVGGWSVPSVEAQNVFLFPAGAISKFRGVMRRA